MEKQGAVEHILIFFSTASSSHSPPVVVVRRRRNRSTSTAEKSACPRLPPPSTATSTTMFQREDDAAKWRQKNGIARVEGVLRDTRFLPHPSIGGSRGYDIPFRQMMVEAYQAGNPAPEGMLRSIQRWIQRPTLHYA
jgi:hypothetical protein